MGYEEFLCVGDSKLEEGCVCQCVHPIPINIHPRRKTPQNEVDIKLNSH